MHVLPPDVVAAQIDAVASDIRHRRGEDRHAGQRRRSSRSSPPPFARWRLPQRRRRSRRWWPRAATVCSTPTRSRSMRQCCCRLRAVVTPNRPEAEVLAGMPRSHAATTRVRRRGGLWTPAAARWSIKGGHFDGARARRTCCSTGATSPRFVTERVDTRNTHGTGCTFAASLAAQLARGRSLPDAVQGATAYVAGAIAHAAPIGHGHGPVEHFWREGGSCRFSCNGQLPLGEFRSAQVSSPAAAATDRSREPQAASREP